MSQPTANAEPRDILAECSLDKYAVDEYVVPEDAALPEHARRELRLSRMVMDGTMFDMNGGDEVSARDVAERVGLQAFGAERETGAEVKKADGDESKSESGSEGIDRDTDTDDEDDYTSYPDADDLLLQDFIREASCRFNLQGLAGGVMRHGSYCRVKEKEQEAEDMADAVLAQLGDSGDRDPGFESMGYEERAVRAALRLEILAEMREDVARRAEMEGGVGDWLSC